MPAYVKDHKIIPFPAPLADKAFSHLMHAIIEGEIAPGEPIRQAILVDRLGVSPDAMRCALSRLEACGLVERTQPYSVRARKLSGCAVRELFELRQALEGVACRLAATAMSDAEIDELADLLDKHREILNASKQKYGGQSEIVYPQGLGDDDFHFLIARGSQNGYLAQLLCEELYYSLSLYRRRSAHCPCRAEAAWEEHLDILAALGARDPEKAEAAMQRHIANSLENLIRIGDAEDLFAEQNGGKRDLA